MVHFCVKINHGTLIHLIDLPDGWLSLPVSGDVIWEEFPFPVPFLFPLPLPLPFPFRFGCRAFGFAWGQVGASCWATGSIASPDA